MKSERDPTQSMRQNDVDKDPAQGQGYLDDDQKGESREDKEEKRKRQQFKLD